jgi:hypothetical protein
MRTELSEMIFTKVDKRQQIDSFGVLEMIFVEIWKTIRKGAKWDE